MTLFWIVFSCFIYTEFVIPGSNAQTQREGFFNSTSYISLHPPLTLNKHIGLSFRSCIGGELFHQRSASHYSMLLDVRSDGLYFVIDLLKKRFETHIKANLLDNEWHTVNILYRLGNLTLFTSGHQQVIANSTYNYEILQNQLELSNDNTILVIGNGFNGCILEGPSIVFNTTQMTAYNVEWGPCPLPLNACGVVDHCSHEPCMMHGKCISQPDRYYCQCTPRYSGNNCQIDNGPPCDRNPCKNNGLCIEDKTGDFVCHCLPGFVGNICELEITARLCENNPCHNNGTCHITGTSNYECICPPGFNGKDCDTNINECLSSPCQHGGTCLDGVGSYTCFCGRTGYTGAHCEVNVNECDNSPCLNNGVCFDNYGGYTCQCIDGFAGQNCELKLNVCASSPCQFPNTLCVDTGGGYQCVCKPGFAGLPNNCTPVDACLSKPCINGATCLSTPDGYKCICPPGFTGKGCEWGRDLYWCAPCANGGTYLRIGNSFTCMCMPGFTGTYCNIPITCAVAPCQHASSCHDYPGGYYCACEMGWTGRNCNQDVRLCSSGPCLNYATCVQAINTFSCICPNGYTGSLCEANIDDCLSSPCQNGGTCFDGVGGYVCNCTSDFMGPNCELRYDACALRPCLNNGKCMTKGDRKEYYCECLPGFEGLNCENNINDCLKNWCPDDKVCVDGINSFDCRCSNGLSGPNCSIDVLHCKSNPCLNGATCLDTTGNYSCLCPNGFKGRHCEVDINECELSPQLCNNGICVNHNGSYQCFCTPGFSGDHCEIDFDECLSRPCYNGASCENRINGFNCICTPGYTGKDCSVNINECDSNPCVSGSTCVDGIATFSCVCPAGLTGKLCETNINDCEPSPCLNGGICIDGLNSYSCNCSETGYKGEHCEHNIDECASNPCVNGGKCKDLVKGYLCECYPGYEGRNCENDIDECINSPCQHGGTCLEKSDLSHYKTEIDPNNVVIPPVFNYTFDFATAAGYECRCIPGITGPNCEENINECLSSPCRWGQCVDQINGYACECEDGFEGPHCEIDIDECERYTPCVHGTCIDKRAGYFCECDTSRAVKYGGKNCSVELTACVHNACENNGICIPYLENETTHNYNCSCPNGFQGHVCEKITTMSLDGSSYVMVNTSREEGYDIQLRFKTTLPNGLLAIGKGSTFYILELVQGRLNLRSSLLNKWEGVFIGSSLNDTDWQKVFVAINSSHLVLAANEEQTIYPINLNEGANSSHTSFPTTYLGGTISYLRKLTNGPSSFIGCIQDAMINSQWVLPQDSGTTPVSVVGVEVGCKREAQCQPNPCHSGGHCTDLWRNFSCTCERPYLGHTCQYNLTAATFGYESINNSVVTVLVDQQARRAVRSILDISMFVRTREPTGGIFFLGSDPDRVGHQDQTIIATKLLGGELLIQIQFNGSLESYSVGGVRLDNGYNHFIQVVRNVTLVQVKINDTEYFRKAIGATEHLDLQILSLGNGSFPLVHPVRNFKGVIQDVQVSDGSRVMVVEFFPLTANDLDVPPPLGKVTFDNSSVLRGVVSDDTCRDEPCMHGGTCTVTWNDFSCICTVGHKGKQCQEMEFCQVQDCPTGSECRNLNHGYECVANITLHEVDEMAVGLKYKLVEGDLSVPLNEVSVSYRSKTGGTILQVGPDEENRYLVISVFRDQVTVSWDLGEGSEFHKIANEQANGDWANVWLKISNENLLTGGLSEESPFTANFSQEVWNALVSSTNITIGGSDSVFAGDRHLYWAPESDQTNTVEFAHGTMTGDLSLLAAVFRGCIGEVRVGGLLLPYFTAEQLNLTNASARDHFELIPGSSIGEEFGCMLCYNTDCNNGGQCKNATESYLCECLAGYAGDDCSENIDECLESDCKNNSTCVDGLANYTCLCQPGWAGTLCDKEIDECASSPCLNNGTCIDHLAKFECRCGNDYVGERCEQLKQITCDNQPCYNNASCENVVNPQTNDNFTCTCQDGFVGVYCKSAFCELTPCQNHGVCISSLTRPVCDCSIGFTGRYCETDIDDCASGPCEHGGACVDSVGAYSCDCSLTGFEGPTCASDIDECSGPMMAPTCPPNAQCINTPGAFFCKCQPGYCGIACNISDPCLINPCKNDGECIPECKENQDYICNCTNGFAGKNCTEKEEMASSIAHVAIIVGPIVCILLIIGVIGLTVFLMMARKKRATRGTYSPSSQEYFNPRVELDNVMKPPPEERLI